MRETKVVEKQETKMQTQEVVVEELVIKENGKEIYGKLYAPKEEGVYPTVILSHGYNGCNVDFMNECRYFASNGFVAYAYDFCGGSVRSKSSGKSTDMTIFTEKEDLLTVLDYIKELEKVDEKQIYLFGGSQGGLVTTLAAEERMDMLKGMILYYPALNIPDDWRKNYASVEDIPETIDFWGLTLGKKFFLDIREFKTFDYIGKFSKDVLIIHGDEDEIVLMDYALQAQKTYANAQLIILPNEGHGYSEKGAKEARELVLHFMQNH